MKYVLMEYGSKKENPVKKFMRKTGVYKKFELYDSDFFETEGYILTLPFLQEEIENYDYCKGEVSKVLRFLRKNCVDFEYCLPKDIRLMGGRNGKVTAALVLRYTFLKFAENQDMQFVKTVVIGNDAKAVMTVVDGIYGGLNFLAVISPYDDDLEEMKKEIYSDTGLDVVELSGLKNPVFMDADIVINCGMETGGMFNSIKKGALYITAKGDSLIKEERKDIVFKSVSTIRTEEDEFDLAEIEAILCAKNYGYRNFINSRYHTEKAKRAYETIKDLLLIDIC